jgi:Ca2+-dependent lipid-binding protein
LQPVLTLCSADWNSKADPFVKLRIGKQDWLKTKIARKTLTPAWNEQCVLASSGFVNELKRCVLQVLVPH